ncbi:hypothetical protein PR048_025778 [Dryococelus australis]|uniref:Uncharacterized protein n=1 Tax=Dryococelus australis TaxID=614101 RepID=A0ABQ9GJI2_9NEOP|nr:hypothetical protein PR048_025778 [Dryococelus australis]
MKSNPPTWRNTQKAKGETASCIKCAIAPKSKPLNWRAVFSSHCVYLWDFQRRPCCFIGGKSVGKSSAGPLSSLFSSDAYILRYGWVWGGVGIKRRGKREISEKTGRPTTSPGTIPTCENPVTRPGIELGSPWWEASVLTTQPPWSHKEIMKTHTILAYTRLKAKSKYRNHIRLERASQKKSSDTHKTPYDRVKRCWELKKKKKEGKKKKKKKKNKASERVNVDGQQLGAEAWRRAVALWELRDSARRDAAVCIMSLVAGPSACLSRQSCFHNSAVHTMKYKIDRRKPDQFCRPSSNFGLEIISILRRVVRHDAQNADADSRNALDADALQRNLLHPDWLPLIALLWNQLKPLVHTVFGASWRTLAQSSPSTVANQCSVDIGTFVHMTVQGVEQNQNERAEETGDPRENPSTTDIVRYDALMAKIRERPCRESSPGSPGWKASSLTTTPPRPPGTIGSVMCWQNYKEASVVERNGMALALEIAREIKNMTDLKISAVKATVRLDNRDGRLLLPPDVLCLSHDRLYPTTDAVYLNGILKEI